MPYTTKDNRARFKKEIEDVRRAMITGCSPGDLDFIITMICQCYIETKGKNFTHINDVVGVLMNVILENNRRVVASYEDAKARDNGDVYYI